MHTDAQLLAFSEHVIYEAVMLLQLHRKLTPPPTDDVLRNGLLEAFAIHARQLISFLYDNKKNPAEIVAEDYFIDARDPRARIEKWKKRRPKKVPRLDDVIGRASEEIAHLTLTRLQPKRSWELLEIAQLIEPIFTLFLQLAPPQRISQQDKGVYDRLKGEYVGWLATIPRPMSPLTSGLPSSGYF